MLGEIEPTLHQIKRNKGKPTKFGKLNWTNDNPKRICGFVFSNK